MLKIINNKRTKIEFSDLEQREIFILDQKGIPSSSIFMKTDIIVDDENPESVILCNAVDLSIGETRAFDKEQPVIPVNGILEINRV